MLLGVAEIEDFYWQLTECARNAAGFWVTCSLCLGANERSAQTCSLTLASDHDE
jgi:hypothetical protein